MYVDRYAPPRVNRGSLTLSTAIVGGLVAAAMLSPTVIERATRDRPLVIYPVRPTPPPPPPDPLPQPQARARTEPSSVPPDPLVTTTRPPVVEWTPPRSSPAFRRPDRARAWAAAPRSNRLSRFRLY